MFYRDAVRSMMSKYRKTEVKRIEGDRKFINKVEKETTALEVERKRILEERTQKEELLVETEKKLEDCKRKAQSQKEERRTMVEKCVDAIVDSMKEKGKETASVESERELSRRKFQIRTKIEEFWKKMDLYENCLLEIEMERKSGGVNGEEENAKGSKNALRRSSSLKKTGSIDNSGGYKEQRKILEELLLRHREAFVANEHKLRHIDTAMESCKKKYADRLEQSNSLLKELKDQKALTAHLIEQEEATEETRWRSDSELVHTLRYVGSVSSPLHIEQEVSKYSEDHEGIFNYSEDAFEERSTPDDGRHKILERTPSKAEKLESRKEKYESMILEAERAVIELKNARALELDQYNIEKEETCELCNKIKERIENDRALLVKIEEETEIENRNRKINEHKIAQVDTQKKRLLESRMKIVELFEKSLQSSLNDATVEIKELQRTGWGNFGILKGHRYPDINEFLGCVMKSVEIYNLDEIATNEAELCTVKEDLNASDVKLNAIKSKEASLQNARLHQIEKRKIRSDLQRVKHYQEISRSVEQLLTIAEGKDPSKVTIHLSKEAQHLAKSREKLEELEKS